MLYPLGLAHSGRAVHVIDDDDGIWSLVQPQIRVQQEAESRGTVMLTVADSLACVHC